MKLCFNLKPHLLCISFHHLALVVSLKFFICCRVPPSLIGQWETEIKKSVENDKLKVMVFATDQKKRIEGIRGGIKVQAREFIGTLIWFRYCSFPLLNVLFFKDMMWF
jgi:hypothetical protein